MSSCKATVIFVKFEGKLNFLDRDSKKSSNIKYHKIRAVGSELLNLESRQTYSRHEEANSRFSQFRERV